MEASRLLLTAVSGLLSLGAVLFIVISARSLSRHFRRLAMSDPGQGRLGLTRSPADAGERASARAPVRFVDGDHAAVRRIAPRYASGTADAQRAVARYFAVLYPAWLREAGAEFLTDVERERTRAAAITIARPPRGAARPSARSAARRPPRCGYA